MSAGSTPPPATKHASPRWRRWVIGATLGLVLLVVLLAVAARIYGYPLAKAWLESPAGPRVAGREIGKSIKVDGTFAPMHLEGWTILTDSFTSVGWPGEAIGSLDAQNVQAVFDPSAISNRAWRFSSIHMDHAVIHLLKPNDALKRPIEPKKPKPWYAIFLPDRFECGPMISEKSDIEFSFQGASSGVHDAHVQADLIGKDLKYTATSGTLDFPYLPPMRIERLEMLVTRPAITIYTTQLAGVDPADPARLVLSGRIGMREDKSIDADVDVTEMSIEKILPENLRPLLQGKISGKLNWHRDIAGDEVTSEGDLRLTGASIHNLSVFKELADLHNNPDLQDFTFDEATCHYRLQGGQLTLNLRARAIGKFDLAGTILYDLKSKAADLNLTVDELPLKIWMPSEFKPRYSGVAKATVKWHGQLDSKENSSATIGLNLDGTHISDPVLLRKFLSSKGFQTPDEIQFDKAQFLFNYQNDIFQLTQAELVAPGLLSAQVTGSLTKDKAMTATMDWQGLTVQDWLPIKIAEQLSGKLDGHIALAVQEWKFGHGSYGGNIRLLNGELHYTSFQSVLARFLNQPTLLKMPLTRTQLSWKIDQRQMNVNDIDIRGTDALGVKGDLAINPAQKLSGLLWIGFKPEYLTWLPDAEKTVFTHQEGGLAWAKVTLSGTTKKPEQDLGTQIVTQLKKHPLALAGLGVKMLSWLVGNWFGEAEEWKRPDSGSSEVSASPARAKAH